MTRVELQPSPFDRLDPVAHAIRWWTSQMLEIVRRQHGKSVSADTIDKQTDRLPRRVEIVLGQTDGFSARAILPKGQADAHRQALDLQVPNLAPASPETLSIVATAVEQTGDGVTTYVVAMARKERLDQLEKIARRMGATSVVFRVAGEATPELVSPTTARRARSTLVLNAALIVCIAVSAAAAVSLWTSRITSEAEAVASQERALRAAALTVEASHKESEIATQLIERGVLKRRGSAALEALSIFNAATPDDAWWTRVRWAPDEVTISAQSPNATAAIGAISSSAKDWSVELSGPLDAAPPGSAQSFEIIAKPREASQP